MSNEPILTRFLYSKDEVKLTLLNSLLTSLSFEECAFWLSELYYSGYYTESWELLWKIYYDFYATKNPKLEKYIKKKYIKWKAEHTIRPILSVLKNLSLLSKNTCCQVFCLRLLMKTQTKRIKSSNPIHLPRGFKSKSKYKNLLLALHRKDYRNLSYYIQKYKNNINELHSTIIYYLCNVIYKSTPSNENQKKINERFFNHPYKNKYHILIALILHFQMPKDKISKKKIQCELLRQK